MITLAELKEKYNVLGDHRSYSLYRKKGEYTYGFRYCGDIEFCNGVAWFNDEAYINIDSLDKALREWEKSLPWPVDTYNPLLRKGAILEDRVIWYLTEKMGFKSTTKDWQSYYIKEIGPNCNISFEVERAKDLDDDYVTIISSYGSYFFRSKFTDADEAVKTISAIVKSEVLQMASGIVDALSVCGNFEIPNLELYTKSNANIFGIEKIDFKSTMISLLENELKKLKSNE